MESFAYTDDDLTEMLDGKIIDMSPRPLVNHNIVSGNIYRIFGNYLSTKDCTPFSDGVDVYLTKIDRVIPDVMIVCNKDIIKKNGIYGAPELIVEVLSPTTAKIDKGYKKNLYEQCGVKEYWIVDTESKSIEVYYLQNQKYILVDVYTIYPDYLIEKMSENEIAQIKSEFSTFLFPEMLINVESVFQKII